MHLNKRIPNTKSWACMFAFEQYIDSPAQSKCSSLSRQLGIISVAGAIVSLYPTVWHSFDLLLSHTKSRLKKPLDTHPKRKSLKIYKLDLIKIKLRLLLFGILLNRMKTQPLMGECLPNHASVKGLVSRIYKNSQNSKSKQCDLKIGERLGQTLHQRRRVCGK